MLGNIFFLVLSLALARTSFASDVSQQPVPPPGTSQQPVPPPGSPSQNPIPPSGGPSQQPVPPPGTSQQPVPPPGPSQQSSKKSPPVIDGIPKPVYCAIQDFIYAFKAWENRNQKIKCLAIIQTPCGPRPACIFQCRCINLEVVLLAGTADSFADVPLPPPIATKPVNMIDGIPQPIYCAIQDLIYAFKAWEKRNDKISCDMMIMTPCGPRPGCS